MPSKVRNIPISLRTIPEGDIPLSKSVARAVEGTVDIPMGDFSKTRVEALSDGIFAIIITLLVLEIKVPHVGDRKSVEELSISLAGLLPKVLSWIMSFLMVCVIWVNHHRLLTRVRLVSHALFWLNANLLLWCSFIPFPTALMGDYTQNPVSHFVFGGILALAAAAFTLMRIYMLRHPETLLEGTDMEAFRAATRRSLLLGPAAYILGALSSLLHPYLAFSIFLLIPLFHLFRHPSFNNNHNHTEHEHSHHRHG